MCLVSVYRATFCLLRCGGSGSKLRLDLCGGGGLLLEAAKVAHLVGVGSPQLRELGLFAVFRDVEYAIPPVIALHARDDAPLHVFRPGGQALKQLPLVAD